MKPGRLMHSTSKASFGPIGTDRKARAVQLPAVSPAALARAPSAGVLEDARGTGGGLMTAKLQASGWERMPELDEACARAFSPRGRAKDKSPALPAPVAKEKAPALPPPAALPPDPPAGPLDDRAARLALEEENVELRSRLEKLERQTVDLVSRKYRSVSGGFFRTKVEHVDSKMPDGDIEQLRRKLEKKGKEIAAVRRDLDDARYEKRELEEELAEMRALAHALNAREPSKVAAACTQTERPVWPEVGVMARPETRFAESQAVAPTLDASTARTPRRMSHAEVETDPEVRVEPSPPPSPKPPVIQAADADTQTAPPAETRDRGLTAVVCCADASVAADDGAAERTAELEEALAKAGEAVRAALDDRKKLAAEHAKAVAAAKFAAAAAATREKEGAAKLAAKEAEVKRLIAELAEERDSGEAWQNRCKEALLQEATKVLVSCPKVTLSLGEKEIAIYGQVDLEDIGKFIRTTLMPKYTSVLEIDRKKGEDVNDVVESLCQALVSDVGDTLKKKVPTVNVTARRLPSKEMP